MYKIHFNIFFYLVISLVFIILLLPLIVFGQDYVPISPLPNTVNDSGDIFVNYAKNIFNIALGLAAILAVGVIVFAGVEYIFTAVSESAKTDAKDRISHAIGGLLLVLAAYIILYTINPELVKLDIFSSG